MKRLTATLVNNVMENKQQQKKRLNRNTFDFFFFLIGELTKSSLESSETSLKSNTPELI